MEVACEIGGALNDRFHWKVDLEGFDMEVVVFISNTNVRLALQLTTESQASRNVTHLGPTTLKANICYCMLKLADIQPGDVILGPMCGSGSLNLEASIAYPDTFQALGENHPDAMSRASKNFLTLG